MQAQAVVDARAWSRLTLRAVVDCCVFSRLYGGDVQKLN
jgi:hypothetical protein